MGKYLHNDVSVILWEMRPISVCFHFAYLIMKYDYILQCESKPHTLLNEKFKFYDFI